MGTDHRRHLIEVFHADMAANRAVVSNVDGSKRAQAGIEFVCLLGRRPIRRGIGEVQCLRLRLAVRANRAVRGESIGAVGIGGGSADDRALCIQELEVSAGDANFICILDAVVIGIVVDEPADRPAIVIAALRGNRHGTGRGTTRALGRRGGAACGCRRPTRRSRCAAD